MSLPLSDRRLPKNTGVQWACCPHCPRHSYHIPYHVYDCVYLCRFRRIGMAWLPSNTPLRRALAEAQERKRQRRISKPWTGVMG